jgi:tRNA-specific 2-thiouridylase
MYVVFEEPQASITEGQFVAWYHDEELLGSGVIS